MISKAQCNILKKMTSGATIWHHADMGAGAWLTISEYNGQPVRSTTFKALRAQGLIERGEPQRRLVMVFDTYRITEAGQKALNHA